MLILHYASTTISSSSALLLCGLNFSDDRCNPSDSVFAIWSGLLWLSCHTAIRYCGEPSTSLLELLKQLCHQGWGAPWPTALSSPSQLCPRGLGWYYLFWWHWTGGSCTDEERKHIWCIHNPEGSPCTPSQGTLPRAEWSCQCSGVPEAWPHWNPFICT